MCLISPFGPFRVRFGGGGPDSVRSEEEASTGDKKGGGYETLQTATRSEE